MMRISNRRDVGHGRGAVRYALRVALTATLFLVAIPALAADSNCAGDGATDDFGYSCAVDSSGAQPLVSDIASTGTALTFGKNSDDAFLSVSGASGETFTFYGANYDTFFIGTNGYVSFGQGYTGFVSNATFPTSVANNVVYAYAADLFTSQGTVYYEQNGSCDANDDDVIDDPCFVVQWDQVGNFTTGSGTITVRAGFVYGTSTVVIDVVQEVAGTSVDETPWTIGIENPSGTDGLRYVESGSDSRTVDAGDSVIFQLDTTAASVTSTTPADNATDVATSTNVVVNFDRGMDPSTVVLSEWNGSSWDSLGTGSASNADTRFTWSSPGFAEDSAVDLQVVGNTAAGTPLTASDVGNTGSCGANAYCWNFSIVDNTAPGTVTKATSTSASFEVALEWAPPSPADPDENNVLVVRRVGAPVDGTPTDGTTYSPGDTIGSTQNVVRFAGASTGSYVDDQVDNNSTYYFSVFTYDEVANYSSGVSLVGTPRASSTFKWIFKTEASALAPSTPLGNDQVVGAGNDRLFQRMASLDGVRAGYEPPLLGGAVQGRPAAGTADFDGDSTDETWAYVAAQDGFIYLIDLNDADGGADAIVASTDVTDSVAVGCSGGILQGGPAGHLAAFDIDTTSSGDAIVVGTRCGATNNAFVAIDPVSLAIVGTPWKDTAANGGNDQLGFVSAAPRILYRENAGTNLAWFTTSSSGGESLTAVEITAGGALVDAPPWVTYDIGDIDTSPEILRRSSDSLVLAGNTDGDIFLINTLTTGRDATPRDSCMAGGCATYVIDGAVRGVAASTTFGTDPSEQNWVTWTTNDALHGILVTGQGLFDESSYWSVSVASPSAPILLAGGGARFIYVGSSDGKLYEYDATDGSLRGSVTVESNTQLGAPSFDFAGGQGSTSNPQAIIVGSTSGRYYSVPLN